MRHIQQLLLLAGLCALVFTSCSKDDYTDSSSETKTYRRTVLIYVAAQNNLGSAGFSKADSMEISDGLQYMESTEDNVLLFLDDNKKPRIYRFYKSSNGKAYFQLLKAYTSDVSSTDPATLLDVLGVMKEKCPSKSYGLVLWSHGSSWLPNMTSFSGLTKSVSSITSGGKLKAFGIDTGVGGNMSKNLTATGELGPQMEIADMAAAIVKSGLHMDYIFFDACLMQSIEVAYDLRNATDYIVASPTTTSAYGSVYQDQIRYGFFAYPTNDENIKKIVDTYYYDVMENEDTKNYYTGQGCIMSVIKTSELDNLAAATSAVVSKAVSGKASVDMSSITGYVNFKEEGYPDSYDMGTAMHLLLPEADYTTWRAAVDKCVIYQQASDAYYYVYLGRDSSVAIDRATYCGVSVFIPQTRYSYSPAYLDYNTAFQQTGWYAAAGWAQTGW